jgi:hypothetical protein
MGSGCARSEEVREPIAFVIVAEECRATVRARNFRFLTNLRLRQAIPGIETDRKDPA